MTNTIDRTKSFLENNIKQVVYASLTDLNWLKKNVNKADHEEIIQQLIRTDKILMQCLTDIDEFILENKKY